MIHARELRIGNCIKDANGKIRFVTDRIISDIASAPERHGYNPLELNEERLRQFGFVTLDAESDIEVWGLDDGSNGEEFSIITDGFDAPKPTVFYFEYDLGYRDVRREIKYVHQLQNLYYAILGEELEVHNLK